ncbi:hypothetical protein ACF0H5_023838 [Mactra antiquata]
MNSIVTHHTFYHISDETILSMDLLNISDSSICRFSPLRTPVQNIHSKQVKKVKNKAKIDSIDDWVKKQGLSLLNKGRKTKKIYQKSKPKSVELLSSTSIDSDSDVSLSKGDYPVQTKRKTDQISLPSSSSDSDSIVIPNKKKKIRNDENKNTLNFATSEEVDKVVDNDDDSSVDDSTDSEVIEPVSKVGPGKKHSKLSVQQKKDKIAVGESIIKERSCKGNVRHRYEAPHDFIVDKEGKYLTQKDIEGKQLFTVTMPSDIDVSLLTGHTININGRKDISIETDKEKSDYEVTAQLYPTEMKRFSSVVLRDGSHQDFRIGQEISGYIQILPCVPLPPSVVLNRTKPRKHTIPDDLPYKLRPFGADSPPRNQDISDVNIVQAEEKTRKHKKKKKHKKGK